MMNLALHSFPPESLRALAEASAAINSTLDLDDVLGQIARFAASVMQAEASSVMRFDRQRNMLIFVAAVGEMGKTLIGKEFDAELGIAGHVLKSGKGQHVSDVASNADFFDGIDRISTFRTHGLLAAPMIYQSEVTGVVEVVNRIGGNAFTDQDLALLQIFANLAATGARNALNHQNLRKENLAMRRSILSDTDIIGASPARARMLDLAERVAPTNATVLLQGETGTGKELLAKHIHNTSPRADKAFVAVNCAALTETLLESELFGHEKGSFTGAIAQHLGRFELADHGTLFLDEIGDISASTQVKLLRLLQERTFTRVGGTKTIACDVRVIAATNRILKQAIEEGKFRDDLYYRLNVFPISLPPLRERQCDIALLAEHFAGLAGANLGVARPTLSDEVVQLLTAYPWPGNIRELANVIERAVLMSDGPEVTAAELPAEILAGEVKVGATGLRANERNMIVDALRACGWNQSQAARDLGITRDNLRYRLKKYDIQRGET